MELNTIKNPLLIAGFFAVVTYLLIWWDEKKRQDKNPKIKKKKPINFITPIVVGCITWFVASNYLNNSHPVDMIDIRTDVQKVLPNIIGGDPMNTLKSQMSQINQMPKVHQVSQMIAPNLNQNIQHAQQFSKMDSLGSASYHIINKNKVRLPPLDVFIDLAPF
jgi:amino acid transporter